MPSEVLLVQGINVKISTGQVTSLSEAVGSPVPNFATLDCISREITVSGGSASEIDVTTICSTAKEFRLGLQDSGTMNVSGHWLQTNAAHIAIKDAAADKLSRLIEVTFVDGSIFRALAFVQQRSWAAAVDGVVTATYTFRMTGATQEA